MSNRRRQCQGLVLNIGVIDSIYLEPIDWHMKPIFDLSVVADSAPSNDSWSVRVYRCRVGAKTINEAYSKLRQVYGFSWWIAEHAYHGSHQR